MLPPRQRAVILQPAGKEALLRGGAFHAGQAGIHVQRICLRLLAGKVGTKLHGCCQLRRLLLQHRLLCLKCFAQRLFPVEDPLYYGQRHIQHPKHPDELEGADIPGGVIAVVIALPARRCEKPLFFVKADVRGRHTALF